MDCFNVTKDKMDRYNDYWIHHQRADTLDVWILKLPWGPGYPLGPYCPMLESRETIIL